MATTRVDTEEISSTRSEKFLAIILTAFVVLQKYLARRIPRSRVRKGECPFCGFSVNAESGPHCEGCGREVVATCATCEHPRRVGSPHCPSCGAA